MGTSAVGVSAQSSPPGRLASQPTSSQHKALLLSISGAIALLSHILFLLLLPTALQRAPSPDYVKFYEPVAQTLAAGGGFTLASKPALLYPCGIPIMYAATFRMADALSIPRKTGLRILEALSLTLTSVLVSLLALQILSWRVALVASTMWSVYPFHLWLTQQPDSTSAFSLLLLCGVLLFVRWCTRGQRSVRYGCLVGLLLGIAALIKPIAIALPIVFAGLACICVVPCRPRQRTLFSFCIVVAFLLTISPWEVAAREASGQWIPLCTNGPNVLIDGLTLGTVRGVKPVWMPKNVRALTQDAVDHYRDLKTTRSIAKFLIAKIREEPIVVAQLFLIKAARSWYGNESHTFEKWVVVIQFFYLPFVLYGARKMFMGDHQHRNFLLIVAAMVLYFWAMATLTALPELRYLVPAMSLVMIVAAVAFDAFAAHCLQRLSSARHRAEVVNLAWRLPHLLQYIYEQNSHSYAVAAVCGQAVVRGRPGINRRRSHDRAGGAAPGPEEAPIHRRRQTARLRQPLRQRRRHPLHAERSDRAEGR
jgi:4-amino-4-deoxy-L-arabinose transferase-like glycosyltransferase